MENLEHSQRTVKNQELLKQLKHNQKMSNNKMRAFSIAGLVLAIGVLLTVVVLILQQGEPKTIISGDSVPTLVNETNGISVGKDGIPGTMNEGAPVVSVYSDYMCPACLMFEETNSDDLAELRADGTITMEYHLISILDAQSKGTQYSTRAANAAITVAELSSGNFVEFADALFDNQPREQTAGLSDEELVNLATKVGVPKDVSAKFTENLYTKWIATATKEALADGLTGTPTIKIDGEALSEDVNWSKPGALREYLEELAAS